VEERVRRETEERVTREVEERVRRETEERVTREVEERVRTEVEEARTQQQNQMEEQIQNERTALQAQMESELQLRRSSAVGHKAGEEHATAALALSEAQAKEALTQALLDADAAWDESRVLRVSSAKHSEEAVAARAQVRGEKEARIFAQEEATAARTEAQAMLMTKLKAQDEAAVARQAKVKAEQAEAEMVLAKMDVEAEVETLQEKVEILMARLKEAEAGKETGKEKGKGVAERAVAEVGKHAAREANEDEDGEHGEHDDVEQMTAGTDLANPPTLRRHNTENKDQGMAVVIGYRHARAYKFGKLYRFEKLRRVWKERDTYITHTKSFMWLKLSDEMGTGVFGDIKGEVLLAGDDEIDVEEVEVVEKANATTLYPFRLAIVGGAAHLFATDTEAMRSQWVNQIRALLAAPTSVAEAREASTNSKHEV
jgi:hypothetical protein